MQQQTTLERGRLWKGEEDYKLCNYVSAHGTGNWKRVAAFIGTGRTAASCRQRWVEFYQPDLKKGDITEEDHEMLSILLLHSKWGNSWSKIACDVPGRTSNQIKNFWNTTVKKTPKELLSAMIEGLVERIEAAGENVECCLPVAAYNELIKLRSELGQSHMQGPSITNSGFIPENASSAAMTSSWNVGTSTYVSSPSDYSDNYDHFWSFDDPKNYTLNL